MAINMEIVQELYTTQIKQQFQDYYDEHYNEEDWENADWDDFVGIGIEAFCDYPGPFCGIYSHLLFFLKLCKKHCPKFEDWDEPQKVYELGLFLVARDALHNVTKEDCERLEQEETDEEETEEAEIQPPQ